MYIEADELLGAIGFQASVMAASYPDPEAEEGEDPVEEGSAFAAVLEEIITAAGELIDAMIKPKVDPATVTGNAILKNICLALSKYEIFNRHARDMVPETVANDQKAAMAQLRDIQLGKLEVMADDAAVAEEQSEWEGLDRQLGTYL